MSFADSVPAAVENCAVPVSPMRASTRVWNHASSMAAGIQFPTMAPISNKMRRVAAGLFCAAKVQPSISWSHFRS